MLPQTTEVSRKRPAAAVAVTKPKGELADDKAASKRKTADTKGQPADVKAPCTPTRKAAKTEPKTFASWMGPPCSDEDRVAREPPR